MPMQPDWPTIRSEGPPPERHADRVISEMTRWMHDDLLKFGPWMEALFKSADVGSPKAQQRLLDRLRKSGCRFLRKPPPNSGMMPPLVTE